jgi:anti-sigma regulatory factor (Ser/Thr protein kinase)
MHCILINEKEYKHINFNINSKSELSSIFNRISEMEIPDLTIGKEQFLDSIIELINNSVCAHNENNINEPVQIRFSIENRDLHITIKDRGRGFDTSVLPYNLDDPVSAIDINGKNFQIYREKYNYKRFGTGLFNAKKTFDDFKLIFFSNTGRIIPRDSLEKEGTIIELVLNGK